MPGSSEPGIEFFCEVNAKRRPRPPELLVGAIRSGLKNQACSWASAYGRATVGLLFLLSAPTVPLATTSCAERDARRQSQATADQIAISRLA